MGPDRMSVRLHLRRIRVIAVLVDAIERLVVEVADVRRVLRCPYCGFRTARVHDTRRFGCGICRRMAGPPPGVGPSPVLLCRMR
jgi:protein-arginine kinase activator protein McsA